MDEEVKKLIERKIEKDKRFKKIGDSAVSLPMTKYDSGLLYYRADEDSSNLGTIRWYPLRRAGEADNLYDVYAKSRARFSRRSKTPYHDWHLRFVGRLLRCVLSQSPKSSHADY